MKRRTPASRTVIGTPPATAPRKKYIVGMGYNSMSASSGLAQRSIPVPPPRAKSRRNRRLPFTSRRKELTEETSLLYTPRIMAMEAPLTPGTSMVLPTIHPLRAVIMYCFMKIVLSQNHRNFVSQLPRPVFPCGTGEESEKRKNGAVQRSCAARPRVVTACFCCTGSAVLSG